MANAHTSRKIEDPAYTTLGWLLPSYQQGQSYVRAFQQQMLRVLQEVGHQARYVMHVLHVSSNSMLFASV